MLNKFITERINVLICTNVAARGLNIKGVKHVSFFKSTIVDFFGTSGFEKCIFLYANFR